MTDGQSELPVVYLQPGEIHVARTPAILKTVLGSCVGVTFWSARLGVGALCHAVLPRMPPATGPAARYRYVDFVIRDLAGQFDRFGAQRGELEVKVFGGAGVLPVHDAHAGRTTVGEQNCRAALEVIGIEQLRVVASDLGGPSGRTIEFHSGTGEVMLRRLTQNNGEPWRK